MSRYYANYSQYLGAQRCCDLRGQGPIGPQGPTGESAIGQRGYTGPPGDSIVGLKGDTGPQGNTGPTTISASMIGGLANSTTTSDSSVNYFGVYVAGTSLELNVTESNTITRIPLICVISDFYVDLTTTPGLGKSYTFTIRKNGIDTPVTVTVSDSSTNGNDITHTTSFYPGDAFTISSTPNNTPATTNLRWSCKLTSI